MRSSLDITVPEKLTTQQLNIHCDRVRDDNTVRLEGRRKKERKKGQRNYSSIQYSILLLFLFCETVLSDTILF